MDNKRAKDIRIVEMAKKKRQLYLLEKLHDNKKSLSRAEMKELDEYFGKKMPSGIVKTQEELAKKLDVSLRTIGYWVKDGLPKTQEGYYDLSKIQEWRFSKNKQSRKTELKEGVDWESEYRKYKAKLAEMEWKEKKGQLVPVRDVEHEVIQEFLRIKQRLLFLPKIIAAQTVGLDIRKVESLCRSRIEEIINDFAQGKFENPTALRRKSKKNK